MKTKGKRVWWTVCGAAMALTLCLAVGGAVAHSKHDDEHHGDHMGKGHDDHDEHLGKGHDDWPRIPGFPSRPCTILGSKIDPTCKAQCERGEKACKAAARQELNSCLTNSCADALAAARAACSAAPGSAECSAAWQAYVSCAQPCFTTYRTAVNSCKNTERACKAACPLLPNTCTPTVDPICVAQCRATQSTCAATAQQAAVGCYAGCQDLSTQVRVACAANPTSADCLSALQALRSCIMPCSLTLRQALDACKSDAKLCMQGCTLATPTPAP